MPNRGETICRSCPCVSTLNSPLAGFNKDFQHGFFIYVGEPRCGIDADTLDEKVDNLDGLVHGCIHAI